jgi:hypothetical protein
MSMLGGTLHGCMHASAQSMDCASVHMDVCLSTGLELSLMGVHSGIVPTTPQNLYCFRSMYGLH